MIPEIEAYYESITRLRGNILKTLDGLSPEALNWKPTDGEANSLFVLATHSIGSEHGWIFETLARGEKTRNRPAEFFAQADDLIALRTQFERVSGETTEIFSQLTEEDMQTTRHNEPRGDVTLRWIILHVIEHLSEHLGQMYLTRQLWEEQVS